MEKRVNLGRHEHGCRVCSHPHREEIEREWVDWGNTTRIAKQHGVSRDSIYRHAHAVGLFAKRRRNLRKALERIIEQAETVPVNAAAVVSAIQAYAKINAQGRWVDRSEHVNLNDLFERMSLEELDAYARDGKLPGWFAETVGATGKDSPDGESV